MSGMKMFVWLDPGDVPWGSDAVVVVANDLEQARGLPLVDCAFGMKHEAPITHNQILTKEPDLILDLPCGLYYMHSE